MPISLTEAAYQDEESLMDIVHNSFDEELTGLKVTNTTKSSVEMESDDYMVEAKGINLDKTGLQNVSLTLTKKAGKIHYQLNYRLLLNKSVQLQRLLQKQ